MIPKIIHHIAPQNKNIWHPLWQRCYDSWKIQFPDFKFILWNDEKDIDSLVKNHFNQFWSTYSSFPVHIMRIDFARFCLLYKYGGIYADMDVFCYKNFYTELDSRVHIVEAPYGDIFLENCLMVSEKDHNFWIDCMSLSQKIYNEEIAHRKFKVPFNDNKNTQRLITSATGPFLASQVWYNWRNSKDLKSLPGITYNNHGLSYLPNYRTKHLMTGMWGSESISFLDKQNENLQNVLGDIYIEETSKYADLNINNIDEFDFYKDYTHGGMKTEYKINYENFIPRNNNKNLNYT